MLNPTNKNSCKLGRCNSNLASNDPVSLYLKQKIIQKQVRVPSSLYTMALGGLTVYQSPSKDTYFHGVNWRQFSDRAIPHIQTAYIPSVKSTRHSYTRLRPGSLSPGGVGVDQKHGSYARRLGQLKGKSALKRGVIVPPDYLPFNCAFPVYGGKSFKTNLVSGYDCPDNCSSQDALIYNTHQLPVFSDFSVEYKLNDILTGSCYTEQIYSECDGCGIIISSN